MCDATMKAHVVMGPWKTFIQNRANPVALRTMMGKTRAIEASALWKVD
jgi:hypothetical protein